MTLVLDVKFNLLGVCNLLSFCKRISGELTLRLKYLQTFSIQKVKTSAVGRSEKFGLQTVIEGPESDPHDWNRVRVLRRPQNCGPISS